MKYSRVVDVLSENGIKFKREGKGSHRIYEGSYLGTIHSVTLSFARPGADVPPGTLSAIIRQSGLPKNLFRA